MRTALTPKEVRSLAMDGGEGLLVLADLALEHGNQELADAAKRGFGNALKQSRQRMFRSIGREVSLTVAARAARRALKRERDGGLEPDKRSWAAVEAVETGGVDGDVVVGARAVTNSYPSSDAYAAYYAADAAYFYSYSNFSVERAVERAAAHAVATAAQYSRQEEELTLQLADIFEVWWESVCTGSKWHPKSKQSET